MSSSVDNNATGPKPVQYATAPKKIPCYQGLLSVANDLSAEKYVVTDGMRDRLRHVGSQRIADALLLRLLDFMKKAKEKEDGEQKQVVRIFAARRMACLYSLLRPAGVKEYEPEGSAVTTDRFLLLNSREHLRDLLAKNFMVCDDSWVTGNTLNSNCQQLANYLNEAAKHSDVNDTPAVSGSAIFLARDEGRNIGDEEGEGAPRLQRIIARTLAAEGVPFFTDFPISKEIQVDQQSLNKFLDSVDPRRVEVSNGALESVFAYTFTLNIEKWVKELDDDLEGLFNSIDRISYAIKIRMFARQDYKGRTFIRFVPKVILRDIECDFLAEKWIHGLGFYLPKEKESKEAVLKQAHGYLQYSLARLLFKTVAKKFEVEFTRAGLEVNDLSVDLEVEQFVLGEQLSRSVSSREHEKIVDDTLKGLPKVVCPSLGENISDFPETEEIKDGVRLLGEALPKQIDIIIGAKSRGDNHNERKPVSYGTIFEELKNCEVFAKESTELGFRPDSYLLAVALDGLNDYGRIVPCHKIEKREGKSFVARSYRMGEASISSDKLEETFAGGRLMRREKTCVRKMAA